MARSTFNDVMLLDEFCEIYGNCTVFVQKVGRLILAANYAAGSFGVSCYALNTTDIPITSYNAAKLREECLTGRKTFKSAFGIHDRDLSREPDVSFKKAMDGSFGIRFKHDLMELSSPGNAEFYNAYVREVKTGVATLGDEGPDDCAGAPWWLRAMTFVDLVESSKIYPRVKVLLTTSGAGAHPPIGGDGFDVVINLDAAGSLVNGLPHTWAVYYDAAVVGIGFSPILGRMNKANLMPFYEKKNIRT